MTPSLCLCLLALLCYQALAAPYMSVDPKIAELRGSLWKGKNGKPEHVAPKATEIQLVAIAKQQKKELVAIAKQQNKQLAAIAIVLRELRDSTAEGQREISRAVKQLLSSQKCLEPFEKFGSMCLHWVALDKSWADAERFCNTLGGFLAWMSDKNEHLVMSRYVREKTHHLDLEHQWFRIGLFRRSSGAPLEWTSGSESSYRGNPFRKVNQAHFSAKAGTTQIYGDTPKYKGYFVCRLA